MLARPTKVPNTLLTAASSCVFHGVTNSKAGISKPPEPAEVRAFSSVVDQDGRFAQVEETLSWIMRFPGGTLASCTCTYGNLMPGYFGVRGSRGTIMMEPAFNYDKLHLLARFEREETVQLAPDDPDPMQFVREADHMADCVLQNKEPKSSGQDGLRDMELIAQIYRACERGAA